MNTNVPPAAAPLSRNEHIKEASGFLRGTLAEGVLAHATGALASRLGEKLAATARACGDFGSRAT